MDEQSAAPAPAPVAPAMNVKGNSQRGASPPRQSAQIPISTSSTSSLASAQEVPGPYTVEEDTDEIKFFLSPDDPNPVVKAATLDKLIERLTYEAYIGASVSPCCGTNAHSLIRHAFSAPIPHYVSLIHHAAGAAREVARALQLNACNSAQRVHRSPRVGATAEADSPARVDRPVTLDH